MPLLRVSREHRRGARVVEIQVFHDTGGLGNGPLSVHQYRESFQRPKFGELRVNLGMLRRKHFPLERRAVFVERDQRLLAVGREGMGIEFQGHRYHRFVEGLTMRRTSAPEIDRL